jgi:hypothetical protein
VRKEYDRFSSPQMSSSGTYIQFPSPQTHSSGTHSQISSPQTSISGTDIGTDSQERHKSHEVSLNVDVESGLEEK